MYGRAAWRIYEFSVAVHMRYPRSATMSTNITRRLFTVHDYHRMADAGILSKNDRVELIYGEILAMSPIGPRHNASVDRITRTMVTVTGEEAIVRVQGSVGLDEYDEPQPDIVPLRPKDDFYASNLPGPSDILLILEVADSSLEYEGRLKARLYAETGVVEYWVVDLTGDCLFAHSRPEEGNYRVLRQCRRGDSIAPQLLPQCRFQIDVFLP